MKEGVGVGGGKEMGRREEGVVQNHFDMWHFTSFGFV